MNPPRFKQVPNMRGYHPTCGNITSTPYRRSITKVGQHSISSVRYDERAKPTFNLPLWFTGNHPLILVPLIPCIISAWHDFNNTCKYKQVRASNFDRILGLVQECHKGNPNSQSLDWTKYPLHSGLTHSILTPQRRIKRLETHYVSGGKMAPWTLNL